MSNQDRVVQRITNLAEALKVRDSETKETLSKLAKFTSSLYESIEKVVAALTEQGIEGISSPERQRISNDIDLFSLSFRGGQFILIPSEDDAFLDQDNPKILENPRFQQEFSSMRAGRLIVLIRSADDISPASVFGTFYIFATGSFCVSKMGLSGFSCEDSFNIDNLETIMNFALLLVEALTVQVTPYWRDPEKVPYEQIFQGSQKPQMGFQRNRD
jgi:hypothetical protein